MSFGIGRGVAEVQILKTNNKKKKKKKKKKKQWNWPYLLKLFEQFDKIMHKHCYWRELDRGIAKCHLFLMKFCIIIDIDKI